MLLWEAKNTKAWSGQWIPKLKDDMIETRATIAILVSVVLPESINRFGLVDGVWVSDPLSAIPLAAALRQQLVAIDRERRSSVGKDEKMEILYRYFAGTEFKQKIEGIVEAFTAMQDQVNRERRAMEKNWKEREKQIERVIKNTVGLYGDMQGIKARGKPSIISLVKYLKALGIAPVVMHDGDFGVEGAEKFNKPISDAVGNADMLIVLNANLEQAMGYQPPASDKPYKAYTKVGEWKSVADVPQAWRDAVTKLFDFTWPAAT